MNKEAVQLLIVFIIVCVIAYWIYYYYVNDNKPANYQIYYDGRGKSQGNQNLSEADVAGLYKFKFLQLLTEEDYWLGRYKLSIIHGYPNEDKIKEHLLQIHHQMAQIFGLIYESGNLGNKYKFLLNNQLALWENLVRGYREDNMHLKQLASSSLFQQTRHMAELFSTVKRNGKDYDFWHNLLVQKLLLSMDQLVSYQNDSIGEEIEQRDKESKITLEMFYLLV